MSQQSSDLLCLATSASVYSFSGTGAMVAKEDSAVVAENYKLVLVGAASWLLG
jgi:hypothetical protein